jgi:hypothetical protein
MECPCCKLINPDAALQCDCGYNFETKTVTTLSTTEEPPDRLDADAATMQPRSRKYWWSLTIAFVLVLLTYCLSGLGVPILGYLNAPGFFAGAIPFPEGINGDFPEAYMIAALSMNVLIYSGVVFGIWTLIDRVRRRK